MQRKYCMKMRHLVVAASAALISSGVIAGGQQSSQSGETRSGQAQTTPQAAADSTIRQAQERLQSEGYAPTPQGLREFQQAKGIQPSGQLDQQTLAALGVAEPAASGASSESAAQPSERPKY
jgi:peptidoglycan hydrolase-like protein with peptidoglycan-binding domain